MKQRRERRTYDQQCGLAFALDVVGERWTLLIIRELLLRPRRYGELLDALPGIGTNLLADRLAALSELGLVQAGGAGRRTGGYQLTPLGQRLREPVLAMARFGLTLLSERRVRTPGSVVRASWAVLAVQAMIDSDRATVDESYEFQVDSEVFHVVVAAGLARVRLGPADDPVLRVTADAATFFAIGSGLVDPVEALLTGTVQVQGPAAAVRRCLTLIGLGAGTREPGLPVATGHDD